MSQIDPALSIIMGVYNSPRKDELDESIESIRKQNFSNWECIICDDGSTDDTWVYLSKKLKNDQRFVLIQNKQNGGLRVALNSCIQRARADFLVRQDADDISHPDRLAILYKTMQDNPDAAVVGTGMIAFDEHGEFGKRVPRYAKPQKRDFLRGSVVAHATCIMRKIAIENVGGYRVAWETMRCEDYDLFMRLHAAGYKIQNIPDLMYYVREDHNTFSRKKYCNRIKEAIVRYKGYRMLHIPLYGYIYVLKPLIVGAIPVSILQRLKRR